MAKKAYVYNGTSWEELGTLSLAGEVAYVSATQTLTNKTFSNPSLMEFKTNDQTALSIDSSGSVRLPYQPRFFVVNENGSTISATNKATFNLVSINQGSCWSAANHRFTAPVSGDYFFDYSLLNNAASAFYIEFRKNGSAMSIGTYPRGYSGTQYVAMTASGIVTLSQNDYVEIWVTGGTMHSYHCFFTGWLVG